MLITNPACCLVEEQPLQRQKRPDQVFADSLCLALGLSSDLAVDVETCMAPAENLLYEGKSDELFPEKQGEDLAGEDFLDDLVMAGRMIHEMGQIVGKGLAALMFLECTYSNFASFTSIHPALNLR